MTAHHAWCSNKDGPRKACKQCDELFERFPTRATNSKKPRARPSLEPHSILHPGKPRPEEATWFYDDKHGILVVHECRDDEGSHYRTDNFVIPWTKLRDALVRNAKI